MPVLMMKAMEGFADRLQVLAHCIRYCKKHNTALCVDWSDGVWGNFEFDFFHIFDLGGLRLMSKAQVISLVKAGAKVNPPCWTLEDITLPCYGKTAHVDYSGLFMTNGSSCPKLEGDVLVTNGQADRTWDVSDIPKHIRMKPWVSLRVYEILKDFNPNSVVVHLRGTDRPDDSFTQHAIATVVQFPEDAPVYVVTDSIPLFYEFATGVPRARLLNPRAALFKLPVTSKQGTHQTNPALLKTYGVSKEDMTIDFLADFVAIWSAQWAVGKRASYFYKQARELAGLPSSALESFLQWSPWHTHRRVKEESGSIDRKIWD